MTETSASAITRLDAHLLDGVEDALVVTRDHDEVPFDPDRIVRTIQTALRTSEQHAVADVARNVLARLPRIATVAGTIPAPAIRALVAACLDDAGHAAAARRCRGEATP